MAMIPNRPVARISSARTTIAAAISAVGRAAMPRNRIQATIGAVMLNVTIEQRQLRPVAERVG